MWKEPGVWKGPGVWKEPGVWKGPGENTKHSSMDLTALWCIAQKNSLRMYSEVAKSVTSGITSPTCNDSG